MQWEEELYILLGVFEGGGGGGCASRQWGSYIFLSFFFFLLGIFFFWRGGGGQKSAINLPEKGGGGSLALPPPLNIITVVFGNIVGPLTLHIKNVNRRLKIILILAPFCHKFGIPDCIQFL